MASFRRLLIYVGFELINPLHFKLSQIVADTFIHTYIIEYINYMNIKYLCLLIILNFQILAALKHSFQVKA